MKANLRALYFDNSKHSDYQNVPQFVQETLGFKVETNRMRRDDISRYEYLIRNVDFTGKRVIDIGANTGYFSLNIAHAFGGIVYSYEVNKNHSELITRIADYCNVSNIKVFSQGVGTEDVKALPNADIMILLNILHHMGSDFDGDLVGNVDQLEQGMVDYLKNVRTKVSSLIFQTGYNWGGDNKKPFISDKDEAEKLETTIKILDKAGWKVGNISLPVFSDTIEFCNIDIEAVRRRRSQMSGIRKLLGKLSVDVQRNTVVNTGRTRPGTSEFFRRPLFICHS